MPMMLLSIFSLMMLRRLYAFSLRDEDAIMIIDADIRAMFIAFTSFSAAHYRQPLSIQSA